MKKTVSWVFLFTVIAMVLASSVAHADLYMKQTKHTDAFTVMGQTQPEKNETVVYWFGKDRVRMDSGDTQSTIVLLDKKVMYVLDHEKKTYAEVPVDFQKAFDAAAGEAEGEEAEKAKEAYQKMTESMLMGMEVKVTDSGESKKIKEWDCRKYVVDLTMPMGKSQSELWATENSKVDPKAYWTAANAMMAAQPGFEKILEEMKKVKGVVVYNITTADVMGAKVKTTEEMVEITEKAAPAGAFDVPKEYKKTESMMME
jgi:hypothetical protein